MIFSHCFAILKNISLTYLEHLIQKKGREHKLNEVYSMLIIVSVYKKRSFLKMTNLLK